MAQPSSTQTLLDSLDRSGKHLEHIGEERRVVWGKMRRVGQPPGNSIRARFCAGACTDSQIAAARHKKVELKQHADNMQSTLEQQRNAERVCPRKLSRLAVCTHPSVIARPQSSALEPSLCCTGGSVCCGCSSSHAAGS
jgi:hypothetical protein